MKKNSNKEEKKCWACKRTLVEENKLGLCPDCVNKYGTLGVMAGGLGLFFNRKTILKIGEQAVKVVPSLMRKFFKV